MGDNEPASDDKTDAASLPGLPDVQVQDLEVEARRVVARARHSVVAAQGESAKNGITEWVRCLFWHFHPEL